MRITGVEITAFRNDGREPRERIGSVVEVHSDTGLIGAGVCWQDARTTASQLGELLIGEDPRGVVTLRQVMLDAAARSSQSSSFDGAISALDVALWDLKAKAQGEPLWRTLGASRPRVNVHAAGFESSLSDDKLSSRCAQSVERFGFRAAKLRTSGEVAADMRRLGLLRQALQSQTRQPELMIDLQERTKPEESIRAIRAIEREFDLTWVEEPCAVSDVAGLGQVSSSVKAAVCAGGNLGSGDFLPYFRQRSLDVVEVDIARGGIGGALEVADCAFGYEIPVVLASSPGNIHAHVAAAMPYCMSLEIVDPEPVDLFKSDVRIVEGWAVAGDRAGHGLEIDRALLTARTLGTARADRSRGTA